MKLTQELKSKIFKASTDVGNKEPVIIEEDGKIFFACHSSITIGPEIIEKIQELHEKNKKIWDFIIPLEGSTIYVTVYEKN